MTVSCRKVPTNVGSVIDAKGAAESLFFRSNRP